MEINPCDQCIVTAMCDFPCDELHIFMKEYLESYTVHRPIVYMKIAWFLRDKRIVLDPEADEGWRAI